MMTRAELLQLPPMISVPLAGRILGLRSRSAAYRAAARGELPTIRMCGKLFVPTELVLQKIGLRSPVDVESRAAS
ncbi:MAG TPA: hypothetical protein VJ735_08090 [Actinomycetes bacterium]|nr:hypothetical protein [Actinomycetes bacterium]